MNTITYFGLLLAFALVGGCASPVSGPVAHRDYMTNLDFTTVTEFSASGLDQEQHLRTFQTNIAEGLSAEYIFGEYHGPMSSTGGHSFHVFPDGCFVIQEFSDIGSPVTLASGRWKLNGNTLHISDLVDRRPTSALLSMKWLKENFGSTDKIRVFVTANGENIGDTILVAEDTCRNGPQVELKYVRRITPYADWPGIERDILKK